MDTKSVFFDKGLISIRGAVSLFPSLGCSDRQGGQSLAFTCDLPLLSQVRLSAWNKTAQCTGTTVSPSLSPDSHQGNGYFICYCMQR